VSVLNLNPSPSPGSKRRSLPFDDVWFAFESGGDLKDDKEAIKDLPPRGVKPQRLGAPPVAASSSTRRVCIYRAPWTSRLAERPLFVRQIYRSPALGKGRLIYDAPPPTPPAPSPPLSPPLRGPSWLRLAVSLGFIRAARFSRNTLPRCSSDRGACGGKASREAGGLDPSLTPLARA